MKRLIIFTITTILIFTINSSGMHANSSLQQRLDPNSAYFQSSSTSNGNRRFLAIGNFLDTTNNAYFRDSTGYLEFTLPDNPEIIWEEARLSLYKYASAASESTEIVAEMLAKNGNVVSKDKTYANTMDYDFQKLDFQFPLDNNEVSSKFRLRAIGNEYGSGIAVCSGFHLDPLCTHSYRPTLSVKFRINKLAQIETLVIADETYENDIYNEISNTQLFKCERKQGCMYIPQIRARDLDENATLKIEIISETREIHKVSGWQLTKNLEDIEKEFSLQDGNYKITIELEDGPHPWKKIETTEIYIDTTPPKAPLNLSSDLVGSREGVIFELDTDINSERVRVAFCPTNSKEAACKTQQLEFVDTNQFSIVYPTRSINLIHGKSYTLVLHSTDSAGNKSEPTFVEFIQDNDIGYFERFELLEDYRPWLSFRNNDNYFEELKFAYKLSKEQRKLIYTIVSVSGDLEISNLIQPTKGEDFKLNPDELNSLPDGEYKIYLSAWDTEDYQFQDSPIQKFKVDNTAPNWALHD